jgi:hypothetical protein
VSTQSPATMKLQTARVLGQQFITSSVMKCLATCVSLVDGFRLLTNTTLYFFQHGHLLLSPFNPLCTLTVEEDIIFAGGIGNPISFSRDTLHYLQRVPGALSPGVKSRPGRDADHSPPSSAEVENE